MFSCHNAIFMLCFGLVTKNTSSVLGKHPGLTWNTCLGDDDHRLRCFGFQRQTAGFGRRQKIHLLLMQASSQIPAGVTGTVIDGLVGLVTAPPSPPPSSCESQLISFSCERDMPRLVQMSTSDLSVVCRNVYCQHYIAATGPELAALTWTCDARDDKDGRQVDMKWEKREGGKAASRRPRHFLGEF